MVYVARTKDAKQRLQRRTFQPLRTVTLACGHTTDERPGVSNPDRWFCCNHWQRSTRV